MPIAAKNDVSLQAIMRKRHHTSMGLARQRRLFSRLLLIVFVSMLTLSAVHVHRVEQLPVCLDCAHHVSHGGHLASGVSHPNDCLLCQLVSVPFVAAQTSAILFFVSSCKACVSWLTTYVIESVVLLKQPRGPPCFSSLCVME